MGFGAINNRFLLFLFIFCLLFNFGFAQTLKEHQPNFIYFNDFRNGNASLNNWVTNGWYVNSEGKAQGYNTWQLYYPNFIEEFYPIENQSTPIFIYMNYTIISGSGRPNCFGLYQNASSTMYDNREIVCWKSWTSLNIYVTRGSSGTISSKDYTFNLGQEYNLGFYINSNPSTSTYKTYVNGVQETTTPTTSYLLTYGDLGLYRLDSFTSSSAVKIDDILVWGGDLLDMPELLYETPIPNLTILSPSNNTVFNNSDFNISFFVVDEDNSSLSCKLELNNTINWTSSVNNNTITDIELNITNDGDYYFELFCDDDNWNNETSGKYFFSVSIIIPCNEDWEANYGICNSSDLQFKTYTDNNVCNTTLNLPIDNGTYVSCNYCSEDLESLIDTCEWNGSDFYTTTTYEDNNYYSCCAITGIIDDCSVDYTYPYNESSYALCNYYANDFEIEYDEQALFSLSSKDKVYWKFYINETNMTEDYNCISYIKHMNNGVVGEIIQVNPEYTKKVEGFVSLDNSFDDREYFKTKKGLGNVYFTKDKLVMDVRQYLFGIQCTGNGKRLVSERVVTAEYESLNDPVNLAFWGNNNMEGLILGFFLLTFLFMIIGSIIYAYRSQWK